jgi:hypothetical protein
LYCHKPDHDKKIFFKLKKKKAQNEHAINFKDNSDQRNYKSQDVVFKETSKNTVGLAEITASQIKAYLMSRTLIRRSL